MRSAPALLICITLAGCALSPRGAGVASGRAIAFTHVAVVDVERGRLLPDQTVVVQGGVIASEGPSTQVAVPAGSEVVDGTGRFLVPGYSDMHVHLYTEGDLLTYVANGITTVRNMAGDSTHLAFRRRIAAGNLIGPRIVTAGPVLEGGPPSSPDNHVVDNPAEVRREIAQQRADGYDFIKVYNRMAPSVYDSVIAVSAALGMPVAGHVPFDVGLGHALASRQGSIEHLRGYVQELQPATAPLRLNGSFRDRTVAWNYVDTSRIASLAARTVAAGVWNCPTLVFSVHEMSPALEHARLLARPEVRYLSRRGLPDRSTAGYLSDFTDADFVATQRGLERQFQLVRALDRVGAGLLVGTDSWLSGFAFAEELELLVRAGLTPARVLRMATADAARFLGNADREGTIALGRRADLVFLDANPLTSIANARRIRAVVLNGRLFRRDDLDALVGALPSSPVRR